MSHVSSVALNITDLDAFAAAVAECGGEFLTGQTTFEWFGRFMNDWRDTNRAAVYQGHDPKQFGHCAHAVRVAGTKGGYEIGLVPSLKGDGSFDLLYDTWGPGRQLEATFGTGLAKLRDEYALQVGMRSMWRQGYTVQRTVNEQTGKPRLVCYQR
jgi:hypothetical protein